MSSKTVSNNSETKSEGTKESTKEVTTTNEKLSAADKPSNKSKRKSPQKKTNNHSYTSGVALIIAIAAVSIASYDFWVLQKQVSVSSQIVKTQNEHQTLLELQNQKLQQSKTDLTKEIQARKIEQAEHQALSRSMESVAAKLGRSTVAWRMAEVEYLLTVANHRLMLAQDRNTAIAIFKTADERIKAIGDTSLLKVRKEIANELLALRAMPEVDISGLTLRIGSLINNIKKLPLRDKKRIAVAVSDETKAEDKQFEWEEVPMAVWTDLKSLVQVRRHQQPTEPLLPPNETRHLYQNLTLKLEQARLSVLRSDTKLFRQYLIEAESWVTNFFEPESPAVLNTVKSLKEMLNIELQPSLPDVSGSLRELRKLLKQQASEK